MSTKAKILIAGTALLAAGVLAQACPIPVFEYALRNWSRGSYYVGYFHRGGADAADAKTNEMLAALAGDKEALTNISFRIIDVEKLAEQKGVEAEGMRIMWERKANRKLPCYVIFTPRGTEMFSGRLTVEDVQDMSRSTLSAEIARKLGSGRRGMLLMLLSGDPAADAKAQQAVAQAAAEAAQSDVGVDVMTLYRDNPKERWLVRQLLAVDPGVSSRAEPMVFGAFGQGWVADPYVGAGVTAENVGDFVAFMNGPCSCLVKGAELRIAVPLLTSFDWNQALAAIADDEQGPADDEQGGPGATSQPAGTDNDTAPVAPAPPTTIAPATQPVRLVARDTGGSNFLILVGLVAAVVLAVVIGGLVLVFVLQKEHR